MRTNWRHPALAASLAMVGLLGAAPGKAQAQIPVYSNEATFAPPAPVFSGPTYVTPTGPTYVVPSRRVVRQQRRYVTLRPNYGGRPALSFAPYSDNYQSRFASPRPTYYVVPPR